MTQAVEVTTEATLLVSANIRRRLLLIANNSDTVTMYVKLDSSSTELTAANGYPIKPNGQLSLSCDPNDWRGPVYGITAANTVDARITEIE